ncbi:hypothetical protein ACSQ6I_05300 [Anabaena sp. WFMT]|uniref:hypothetical protein n=1 Tax=Anabaena sp. WFMT TaxID=3449730 RepID=UPI003F24F0F9
MSNLLNLPNDQEILLQGLAIIIGLPIVVIGLGELTEQCKRHKNPLAQILNATRNLLLPPLSLWLVMAHFFDVPKDSLALRIIGSLSGLLVV